MVNRQWSIDDWPLTIDGFCPGVSMVVLPPAKRKSLGRPTDAMANRPAPPQTLVLVSASYDENEPVLFLTFDRAVDASAFVAGQVIVNDGSFDSGVYGGVGPAGILSPTQISVVLELLSGTPPGPVTMTATALTGLAAVDDGGTWAGVSDVGLPFDG
jgi:hypothetical protein